MSIDLNVLNHLGMHLYSNVAAVLSEAVANAWDADASKVEIDLDTKADTITICDNGIGMNVRDVNDKYLNVGYDKRKTEGERTKKKRPFMGRKGIGKLSLFSIASTVRLESVKDEVKHGLVMKVGDIESAIKKKMPYEPPAVNVGEIKIKKGTRLALGDLKRHRLHHTADALRKRIARRFSVIGTNDFRVFVGGKEVTAKDRDDLRMVQFLWEIGADGNYTKKDCPKLVRRDAFDGTIDEQKDWRVHGWIGAVEKPRQLVSADGGNLNSIVVLARGRLIQENILDRINDGRIFTKYLTGQIDAEFLDISDQEDIATSDRQRVIEDDPRSQAVEKYVRRCLNEIADKWTEWRNEIGAEGAQLETPALKAWLDTLSKGAKEHASKLIARIHGLSLDNEDDRRVLYRHGILAFERLRVSEQIDRLPDAISGGTKSLLALFSEVDDLEAALYHDITNVRMEVINAFKGLVDENQKEVVLRDYLFDHLWLIDPSWERAAASPLIESRITKEFKKIDAKLTPEEKKGRVDIKYRTTAGKHVIIELKRANRIVSAVDLAKQGRKYETALRKCLDAANKDDPYEIVFVLGRKVQEANDPEFVEHQLASVKGRVAYYDELIDQALEQYKAYTKAKEKVNKIAQVVKGLASGKS